VSQYLPPPGRIPADRGFQLELTGMDLEESRDLLVAFEEFCRKNAVPDKVMYRFELALDEVVSNALNYGFQNGSENTAPGDPGRIKVTLLRESDALTAWVVDSGTAFNPLENPDEPDIELAADDRPVGGLGLFLVRSFVDELTYERSGGRNRLRLSQPIK